MKLDPRSPGATPASRRIVLVLSLVVLASLGSGASCRTDPLVRPAEPGELDSPAEPVEVDPVEPAEELEPVIDEPAPQPSREDALQERFFARWDFILVGDWSGAYEFLTPERRIEDRREEYQEGKEYHEYSNLSDVRVLDVREDRAYVVLTIDWTPRHPELEVATNQEDLTQRLEIVETWTRIDDQWFWLETARTKDFFLEHPELSDG